MPPEPRPVQATETTGGETQIGEDVARTQTRGVVDIQESQGRLDELNKQLASAQETVRIAINQLGQIAKVKVPGKVTRTKVGEDRENNIPIFDERTEPDTEEVDPRGVAKANAALDEARAQETRIYEEIAAETARKYELIEAQRASEGKPLSPEEQQIREAEIAIAQSNVSIAKSEARTANAQARINEAEANGDVGAAEQARLDLAAAQEERQANNDIWEQQYADAGRVLEQNADAREALLSPYAVLQAEDTARIGEVEATKAERLLESDIDLAIANLEWQLTENKIAQADYEKQRRILDAGGPEADVLATQLANDYQAIQNQQTAEGDPVTKLNQLKDALAAGRISQSRADTMATEYLTGETLAQRQNTIDSRLGSLAQSALERGIFVSPGQTSGDPHGNLQKALGGVGIDFTPQQFTPRSVPQWARDIGMNTDPNMGVGQTFTEEGGWAGTVGQGGPPDLRSMPDDVVRRMLGGQSPAAVANGLSQGAGASPGTNAPVTINIGGGPSSAPQPVSAAGAPPPVVQTAGGPPPSGPAPNSLAAGPRRYGQGNPNAWYRSIAGA